MKKEHNIFFLLLGIILIFPLISSITITGEVITGKVSVQPTNVSVTILPATLLLRIDSPSNGSVYNDGDYILLSYTARLIDSVWYNLNGTNVSINSSIYFTASVGTYTLYLYGNQSNGTILSDSVVFSVIPVEVPSVSPGGKKREVIDSIEVNVEDFLLSLNQGETKLIAIEIKNNNLDKSANVNLKDLNLDDLLVGFSEDFISLAPGEIKYINVIFSASIDKIPGLYIERIVVSTDKKEKEITFFVEVESAPALFDVKLNLIKEPPVYTLGEILESKIDFFNLGIGKTELEIEYWIVDSNGKFTLIRTDTLVSEVPVSLTRAFEIPFNLRNGEYLLYVKVKYQDKVASASELFYIEFEIKTLKERFYEQLESFKVGFEDKKDGLAIAIIIFLTAILLYLVCKKLKQEERKPKRYSIRKVLEELLKRRRGVKKNSNKVKVLVKKAYR